MPSRYNRADSWQAERSFKEADNIGSEVGPEEWNRFSPVQPETHFGFARSSLREIVGCAVYVSRLEEAYGTIAYYLDHPAAIDDYLLLRDE